METKRVTAVYFSPCGNAGKIAERIAASMAEVLQAERATVDFTLPGAREQVYTFGPEDVVVFVMPVYAGRLPNKMLPCVQELFKGDHTKAVIACSYGNRSFGDGLTELRDELVNNGLCPLRQQPSRQSTPLTAAWPREGRTQRIWKPSVRLPSRRQSGSRREPQRPLYRCPATAGGPLLYAPGTGRSACQVPESKTSDGYGKMQQMRDLRRCLSHGLHRGRLCDRIRCVHKCQACVRKCPGGRQIF